MRTMKEKYEAILNNVAKANEKDFNIIVDDFTPPTFRAKLKPIKNGSNMVYPYELDSSANDTDYKAYIIYVLHYVGYEPQDMLLDWE